jgi:hypothetical protein
MTTIANAYINALLADAAYVNLLNEPLDSTSNNRILQDRLTSTQADYLAANVEVASIANYSDIPFVGSGFDATVWRGKEGTEFAGQTFVSLGGKGARLALKRWTRARRRWNWSSRTDWATRCWLRARCGWAAWMVQPCVHGAYQSRFWTPCKGKREALRYNGRLSSKQQSQAQFKQHSLLKASAKSPS